MQASQSPDDIVAAILREGAQRYTFLADLMPLIIWTAKPDGNLDYYNKAWFDYTGLTLAQTQDWGWGPVLHPDDLQRCIDRWTHSFTTGEKYEIEYRFKRGADGSYRWFLGRASPRYDEAGKIVQWVGTGTDIDDQKRANSDLEERVAERTLELRHSNQMLKVEVAERFRAQEELQWKTAFLEAQVDSSIDGIIVVDSHGQQILQNQRMAGMFDMPQHIADNRDIAQKLKWFVDFVKKPEPFMAKIEYLFAHPAEVSRDEIELKNGNVLDRYSAPVLGKDGKNYGRIWTLRDITKYKQIEATLQRQKAEFQILFDLIPAMIWFKDTKNRVLRINQHVADMTGLKVAEIEGKSVEENHPEEAAKYYADDLQVIQSGTPKLGIIETIRNRDGKEISIQTDKVPFRDKDGKVVGIVVMAQDITERKKAEESLRLLSSAVEQSKESILITDAELNLPGPKIIFTNPAFTKMTGYTAEEVIGQTPRILQGPRTDKMVIRRLRKNLEQGEVFAGEAINYRKDRTEFNMEWQIAPIRNPSGTITHFVAIQHDITERKRLEAQLFQSQKLETVGKLAGGVAHEFNSIMTAIIGQSELLLADLPPGNPLRKNATEIRLSGERAAVLTRQLLAYGRKQVLRPESVGLNNVLTGMEAYLRHLLGRAVDCRFVLAAKLKATKADAGQIEQVIMNLVMNAADAMPQGGKLTLETANVILDQQFVGNFPELKVGEYVMLAVTDTGTGMSEEVKAHVFEPFFTTKGVGEGTGLGLSTCYGIVKQTGGHITVYSEFGQGTTFRVYLPALELDTAPPFSPPKPSNLPRGTETILLVEDEAALRQLESTLLGRLGYTVLTASDGIEALNLLKQQDGKPVDLLFTDVVMVRMGGKELSERVLALSPQTKVLFASAFTENAIVHQEALNPGVAMLQKPFTPGALANKVRELLDLPGNPNPAPSPEPEALVG